MGKELENDSEIIKEAQEDAKAILENVDDKARKKYEKTYRVKPAEENLLEKFEPLLDDNTTECKEWEFREVVFMSNYVLEKLEKQVKEQVKEIDKFKADKNILENKKENLNTRIERNRKKFFGFFYNLIPNFRLARIRYRIKELDACVCYEAKVNEVLEEKCGKIRENIEKIKVRIGSKEVHKIASRRKSLASMLQGFLPSGEKKDCSSGRVLKGLRVVMSASKGGGVRHYTQK